MFYIDDEIMMELII